LIAGDARTPAEIREAVYLSVGDTGAKQSRFWLLLALATGIATAGIVSDSTATVIGAMIIAPLATPIQGVAVGIAFGEVGPLLRSLATLLLAIAVTITFAALLSALLPQLEPLTHNSQVTGRVSPTIVDLVAAAFTGLAGSAAITRRDIGDILPGVAIAISLVPPLAVVGVTADHGDWSGSLGALLLFATNVLAITLIGVAVFSAARLRHEGPGTHRARPAYAVVVIASAIVSAALALSTYRTVQLSTGSRPPSRPLRNGRPNTGSSCSRSGLTAARSCSPSRAAPTVGRTSSYSSFSTAKCPTAHPSPSTVSQAALTTSATSATASSANTRKPRGRRHLVRADPAISQIVAS
jgi:uncharacterized hydrophobic protein (TIGR00271 family)